MRHLRNKSCKEKLGEAKLAELRETAKKAKQRRYNKSLKGKQRYESYNDSEKASDAQFRYSQTAKSRSRHEKYLDKKRETDYDQNLKAQAERKQKFLDKTRPDRIRRKFVPKNWTPEEKQKRREELNQVKQAGPATRSCVVCAQVVFPVNEGLLTLEFIELLEARGGSKMVERLEIYKRNLDQPLFMCSSCTGKFNERSWFFHRQTNEACRVLKYGCKCKFKK